MRKIILLTFYVIFIASLFAQSPHGKDFKLKCVTCHTTNNWAKIKTDSFDHKNTDFPLIGQHKTVYCRKCHVDLNFKNAKRECISCHKDVHELTLGRNCERCHTPASWIVQNITQIHQQSRFPLIGRHAQLDCNQCHKSASLLRFDPMRSECVDCHLKDYNATTAPNHVSGNFSKDCMQCHTQQNWTSSSFNHNSTGFPLTGTHANVACTSCHPNGYSAIPTTCVSCHLSSFNATTNPNHTTSKFSTDCQTCHNTTTWSPSTFNHNTSTAFPLTGAHISVTCVSCHTNGYAAIPTTCSSCHLANYNTTTNPNHKTAKFPTTCETCHSTTNWTSTTFNHSTSTTFPLTGAHITLACTQCHPANYNAIPTTCVSCHLATYNATTNPNHVTAKFPTTCETCHSTTNWTSSTFNHSTSTTFPLTGAHKTLTCTQCHPTNYNAIPTTCVSCHLAKYNATTNPNHIGAKFATTCETCHSTTNWTSATFNHNAVATIPLTGNHNLSCSTCHTTPTNYAIFSCRQVGCHSTAHNASAGSTGCYSCHPTGRAG